MKKFLLVLAIFLFPLVSLASSVSPLEFYLDDPTNIVLDIDSGDYIEVYDPSDTYRGAYVTGDSGSYGLDYIFGDPIPTGISHFILTSGDDCHNPTELSYEDCLLSPDYVSTYDVFISESAGSSGLPAMTATTSAVFSSIGLDSETIYAVFQGIVGVAVDFGLFLVQISWPFLLGIAFIYLMWRLAHKFMGFGRR